LLKPPCKDCPTRHYLCHSTCEKYLEFRRCREEFLERKHKQNQLENDLWAVSRHHKKYRPYSYKDGHGNK
jgi:hypothetical protein